MDDDIFNVRTDINACDCTRGCRDTVEESALKVDSGRKIPCRTGESNLRRRCTGPTLYQLSYIPTLIWYWWIVWLALLVIHSFRLKLCSFFFFFSFLVPTATTTRLSRAWNVDCPLRQRRTPWTSLWNSTSTPHSWRQGVLNYASLFKVGIHHHHHHTPQPPPTPPQGIMIST